MDDETPIISLAAWRKQRTAKPQRHIRVTATAVDRIEIELTVGTVSSGAWTTSGKGAKQLVKQLKAAITQARTWNDPPCRACGFINCHRWHVGLVVARDSRKCVYLGMTSRGRHRLRDVNTGKLWYTTSHRPTYWGRVVGWVDISPKADR